MNLAPLSIIEELKKFRLHLHPEENEHIIFSGIFGIGKSYFINEFFDNYEDDYLAIKLNPVNYSVASNEDIFEYMKYDIAFELLKEFPLQEYSNPEKSLNRQVFFKQNFKSILWELAKNGSKVHQSFEAIFSVVETLYNKLDEADEMTPQVQINNFFEDLKTKKGSIHENDMITQLIRELISDTTRINKKKPVLIIDDLDRIDPEHIFRILNVFSAQVDLANNGRHKLGFNKIILICDIQNIRNIFHHRYGSDTDFSGYIDKFYSTEIFEYNFKNILSRKLHKIFEKLEYGNDITNHIFTNFKEVTYYLHFTIIRFFQVGALSTRSIVNFLSQPFEVEDFSIEIRHKRHSPLLSFFVFDFLEKLCGGELELKSALQKASQRFQKVEIQKFSIEYLQDLIILIDVENNHFTPSHENYIYRNKEFNFSLVYKISTTGYGIKGEHVLLSTYLENLDKNNLEAASNHIQHFIPIFDVLLEAYKTKKRQTIIF